MSLVAVLAAGCHLDALLEDPGPPLRVMAADLAFVQAPPSSAAGAVLAPSVTVAARDASGAVDTLFRDSVTVTITPGTGGPDAVLSGDQRVPAVDGVAVFHDLSINRSGSAYQLDAVAPGLSARSSPFEIRPAEAARVAFTRQPGGTVAGTRIAPAVEVVVTDAFGNVVVDYAGAVTMDLAAGGAGASLSGTRTVTPHRGTAVFSDLSLERAGAYRLEAASGGLTRAVSEAFLVAPAGATGLRFTVQPTDARVNQAITPAVRVEVIDAYGNTATAFSGTITIGIGNNPSLLGLASLQGTRTVAVAEGVAVFSDLRIDGPGQGFTLIVASSALASAESAGFNVSAL